MRNIFPILKISLALFFSFMLWGCTSANPDSPMLDSNGQHPPGWIEYHRNAFKKNSEQCVTCHGSFTESASSGGISGVSCFSAKRGSQSCHPNGPSAHPLGWEAPAQHGRTGAMAAPSARSGFAYCTNCHGSLYNNGTARSCMSCHTNAPHPDRPWHGTTPSRTNHVFTNPLNAAECAKCHTAGKNLSVPLLRSYASGTPGCFNSTLCHDQNIGHPGGWDEPTQHGAAAKAVVTGSTGMGYCRTCHDSNFSGGTTGFSCTNLCHINSTAPHAMPWTSTSTYRHSTTDQTNAPTCGLCHAGGAFLTTVGTSPANAGCFNGTLCHGSGVTAPHSTGATYLNTGHWPDAEANLANCQPCHATPASGSNPRFNVSKGLMSSGCEDCHTTLTAHPTPWLPGRPGGVPGNTTTHATAGNISIACALCHGASLTGGVNAPSCMATSFDGVRCHVSNPATKPTGCTSCHAKPPNGTVFPNTGNSHSEHHVFFVTAQDACTACHNGHGVNVATQIGTATHANGTANVSLSATYLAKTGGAFAFTAGKTCANVRCHGGQTTPAWINGVINETSDCSKCHRSRATSDQYNSYFSGSHDDHVGRFACTTCHDTAKLANGHFSNLATPAFELAPHNTITFVNPDNGNILTATYNATTKLYTCTFTCHGESHSGRTWQGF